MNEDGKSVKVDLTDEAKATAFQLSSCEDVLTSEILSTLETPYCS